MGNKYSLNPQKNKKNGLNTKRKKLQSKEEWLKCKSQSYNVG